MYKILSIIILLLLVNIAKAQYIPNSAAYQYKGLKQTNSLQPPTGTAFPVTLTNAPDSNYAAWYYNTTDTSFYQWNPIPHTWTKLQSNGGVTIDSVFITSIDSLFITNTDSIFIISGNDTIFIGSDSSVTVSNFEKNITRDSIILTMTNGMRYAVEDSTNTGSGIDSIFITNTDSIFIITGNDTIFIGTGNPAVDTVYQRGDSIFGVKSGIEFLAALTGAAAPSGGMDTAYSRGDSIFGKKNNAEFLIAEVQQAIDSIFITNTDSIFIISGNDTIFIGNSNINWEQTLQNQGLTPFTTDNTVNFSNHNLILDSLNNFQVHRYDAGNAANFYLGAHYMEATDAVHSGTVGYLFPDGLYSLAMGDLSNNHEHRQFIYSDSIVFTALNNALSIRMRGLDSSNADPNNVAWFDADNVLHRGHIAASGGSSSIILDSFTVDFDGLHPTVSVPISAAAAKNIDISPEADSAGGFRFGWNTTEAVLKYQAAIKGTYKFYITYYQ